MSFDQDYEEMSVEEKVKRIEESISLGDLPARVLPPVPIIRPDTYFFISYSHKDYKKVYKDIFDLQAQGVNVWYDGGMPIGRSWEDVADEYIRPYKCAGVIFYVSENSLMSEAIHKEMEFAKANGKMCITINLPVEGDFVYNGESVQGKEISAQALLDVLRESEKDKAHKVITDEKYNIISDMFGYNVLFMPYSTSPENKRTQILDTYEKHKEPLLIFEERKFPSGDEECIVIGIKDIDIKNITLSDFIYKNDKGEILEITKIDDCAFANCRYLESIELPLSLMYIGDHAFFNCKRLKKIILSEMVVLGNSVFSRCSSLTSVTIPDGLMMSIGDFEFSECSRLTNVRIPNSVMTIKPWAFYGCSGFTDITIPDGVTSISSSAFARCSGVMSITVSSGNSKYHSNNNCLIETATKTLIVGCNNSIIPADGSVTNIGRDAFHGCSGLTSITIPDSVTSIDHYAFYDCTVLASVTISNSVTSIGSTAFISCSKLDSIIYQGTKKEWEQIKKESDWDSGTPEYIVHCLDGDLRKGEQN